MPAMLKSFASIFLVPGSMLGGHCGIAIRGIAITARGRSLGDSDGQHLAHQLDALHYLPGTGNHVLKNEMVSVASISREVEGYNQTRVNGTFPGRAGPCCTGLCVQAPQPVTTGYPRSDTWEIR